ncbi:putative protein TPRXL [Hyalella azteca]|uniref:Uncharacterized protein n=1 Tax=Hyalella azteca TaxID=294128 RepID=A0A979FSQ5_HYAAZ|nr:putative protein TPRXL [Hyalella azteca]
MGERNVSFLDPDCIRENMFGMDGMHLNPEGTEVLERKVKRSSSSAGSSSNSSSSSSSSSNNNSSSSSSSAGSSSNSSSSSSSSSNNNSSSSSSSAGSSSNSSSSSSSSSNNNSSSSSSSAGSSSNSSSSSSSGSSEEEETSDEESSSRSSSCSSGSEDEAKRSGEHRPISRLPRNKPLPRHKPELVASPRASDESHVEEDEEDFPPPKLSPAVSPSKIGPSSPFKRSISSPQKSPVKSCIKPVSATVKHRTKEPSQEAATLPPSKEATNSIKTKPGKCRALASHELRPDLEQEFEKLLTGVKPATQAPARSSGSPSDRQEKIQAASSLQSQRHY